MLRREPEALPESGTLIRTSCESGETSIVVFKGHGSEIVRQATELSMRAGSEADLICLIRDQIGALVAEIEAAILGAFPRHPTNEESAKGVIALFTLGLIAGRSDLALAVRKQLREDRGIIAVHLAGDSVRIVVTGSS